MNRRAKKLEQKRKARDLSKKRAQASAARRPSEKDLLVKAGARCGFGPCFISAGWDDNSQADLVSVVVTRELPSGELLPAFALVDRTCLGIKEAFVSAPVVASQLADLVDRLGTPHGGMLPCEPLLAQSVVFHAVDFARSLGFFPHPDFTAPMFGPRPEQLLETPWRAPVRPYYSAGPYDNVHQILVRLNAAVGAGNYDVKIPGGELIDQDGSDDLLDDQLKGGAGHPDEEELCESPLSRTVTEAGITAQICIYRLASEQEWTLEIDTGGSTVWQDRFPTDQAALDEALQAIQQEGLQSFVVPDSVEPE
jgi:hypothetical protein